MTRTLTSDEWNAIDSDLFACRIQGAALRMWNMGACDLLEAFNVTQRRVVQLAVERPGEFDGLEPYRQLGWLPTAQ